MGSPTIPFPEDVIPLNQTGPAGPSAGMSPEEVALYYGVDVDTVRRWIKSGKLNATRVGPRLLRIAAADVEALAKPVTSA